IRSGDGFGVGNPSGTSVNHPHPENVICDAHNLFRAGRAWDIDPPFYCCRLGGWSTSLTNHSSFGVDFVYSLMCDDHNLEACSFKIPKSSRHHVQAFGRAGVVLDGSNGLIVADMLFHIEAEDEAAKLTGGVDCEGAEFHSSPVY